MKLKGIRNYALGVTKIFDSRSRVQVVSTAVNGTRTTEGEATDVVTVQWRISGGVNILGGLTIKVRQSHPLAA